MADYLLRVADQDAALLESWLGGKLLIVPAGSRMLLRPVAVAGLDALTAAGVTVISARLSTGGPEYHAGGPGGRQAGIERQLDEALRMVRLHPSRTARRLSGVIFTSRAEPVTEGRARMLLRELEKRGLVSRWKRPGTRAWLWDPVPLTQVKEGTRL